MSYFPESIVIQEDVENKNLQQYKESFNFNVILTAQTKQLQILQDTLQDLLTKVNLTSADGAILDDLGDIAQIPRQGLESDDSYRSRIISTISAKTGSGTPDQIINVAKLLTTASYCLYWEHYPANYVLEIDGSTILESLISNLKKISPAGVGNIALLSVMKDQTVFRPANLAYYMGDLVDNLENNLVDDSNQKIRVIYNTSENYDVAVYNTSYLPDVVEVLDAGDVYLVDNNQNFFITNNNDNIITGINPSYGDIILTSTDGCLAEVYQYATT